MARPLQHGQTPQRIGLPPTRAQKHRSNGPEAHDALTIKPDHPKGARQRSKGAFGANERRLENIKAKVDPANLFRANVMIQPNP
ncbi:hypothetical protein EI983_03975 [Roseovarius faecimaris]|uniref:Berberine/berberine-like domain-containing protein n=1 Tax=Roseovarius faecimaris TaxID=2494550 RepID=A0A6I6IKT0_9RHOB|nr:hypothetical protein EI983_03975 [Roseovarius faecimaris]